MTAAYSRVTVVNGSRRADLALPAALPLADVVPQLLRICGPDGNPTEPSRWSVGRMGDGTLDLGQSLESAGVADGEVLELRPLRSPLRPAFVEDVRDVLEDAIDGSASFWSPRDTARWAGAALAAVSVVAAASQLDAAGQGWVLGLHAAVALVLIGATALVARPAGVATAVLLAASATVWGALAGWDGAQLADAPLPGVLLLAGTGALLVAGACRLVVAVTEPVMVAVIAVEIAAALTGLGLLIGTTVVQASALVATGTVLVIGTLPRLALAAGGVVAADYRIRTGRAVLVDDLNHRVSRSNGLLIGLATGLGLVGLAGTAVLVTAADPLARWLALAIPLCQLLRSRAFSVVAQVTPLRLAGSVGLALNVVPLYLGVAPDLRPLVLAGVIGAAAVLALIGSAELSQVSSARVKRLLTIAEWPVVITTLVLAAGAAGLYEWVFSIAP